LHDDAPPKIEVSPRVPRQDAKSAGLRPVIVMDAAPGFEDWQAAIVAALQQFRRLLSKNRRNPPF